jgi:hypothetical protein
VGALGVASTPASSAPLTDRERSVVIVVVSAMMLQTQCPGLKMVDAGPIVFADKNGVDFTRIGGAILNAILIGTNKAYDRGKLIPEVTLQVSATAREILNGLKVDHADTCDKLAEQLVPLGLLQSTR